MCVQRGVFRSFANLFVALEGASEAAECLAFEFFAVLGCGYGDQATRTLGHVDTPQVHASVFGDDVLYGEAGGDYSGAGRECGFDLAGAAACGGEHGYEGAAPFAA